MNSKDLAGICLHSPLPWVAQRRERIRAALADRVAAGTYVPGLAWVQWLALVDLVSEWLQRCPDVPARRDDRGSGEPWSTRWAHRTSTRKAAARLLAQWVK